MNVPPSKKPDSSFAIIYLIVAVASLSYGIYFLFRGDQPFEVSGKTNLVKAVIGFFYSLGGNMGVFGFMLAIAAIFGFAAFKSKKKSQQIS